MNTELLRPRYWPVWLGLGVLRLLVALPARLQLRLGAACGQLASQFNQRRRRIVAVNLQLCFPDLDQGYLYFVIIWRILRHLYTISLIKRTVALKVTIVKSLDRSKSALKI